MAISNNLVKIVSTEEETKNWTAFSRTVSEETIENWKATPYMNKFLTEETAVSAYYLGGLEIYKGDGGNYFYMDIRSYSEDFFTYGDTAPASELTPLPDELLADVRDLAEADSAVAPYGFQLVRIVYNNADNVMFTLYSEELQHYCTMERASFECVGPDTHRQLAQSGPEPNTLANPLWLILNDDGNICGEEEANTNA